MKAMAKAAPKQILTCPNCGKQFFKKNGNQKYCQKKCADSFIRKKERERKKFLICLRCGENYEVGYNCNRSFCDRCSAAIKMEKEQEKRLMTEQKRQRQMLLKQMGKKTVSEGEAPGGSAKKAERPVKRITGQEEKPVLPKVYARLKIDPARLIKPPFEPTRAYKENPRPENRYEDMSKYIKVVECSKNRNGTEYEEWEDNLILDMKAGGATNTEIAIKIGRTPASVMRRTIKLKEKKAPELEAVP